MSVQTLTAIYRNHSVLITILPYSPRPIRTDRTIIVRGCSNWRVLRNLQQYVFSSNVSYTLPLFDITSQVIYASISSPSS
jgi:hypothetical protein